MQKKRRISIVVLSLMTILNLIFFGISWNYVSAAGDPCEESTECEHGADCRDEVEGECASFCYFIYGEDCDRVVFWNNGSCATDCTCWGTWTMYCTGDYQQGTICGESWNFDCTWPQK